MIKKKSWTSHGAFSSSLLVPTLALDEQQKPLSQINAFMPQVDFGQFPTNKQKIVSLWKTEYQGDNGKRTPKGSLTTVLSNSQGHSELQSHWIYYQVGMAKNLPT